MIVPSTLLTGVAILGYGAAGTFVGFMLCSIFWSAASGVSGAAPTAYTADIAPAGMTAPTMGLYRALADAGYVAGPLVLGIISDIGSPIAALAFTSVILIGSGILFAVRAPESLPGRVVAPKVEGSLPP